MRSVDPARLSMSRDIPSRDDFQTGLTGGNAFRSRSSPVKREAVGHTKMKKLCRLLDIPVYQGIGILEGIWHLTAREAQRGDIGKLSNEDIALGIDYRGDEEKLISALVKCEWLDEHPQFRLVVHDWHEHADDAVKKRIARSGSGFCQPTADNSRDRQISADDGRQRQPPAELGSLPVPVPVPDPVPVPAPLPGGGAVIASSDGVDSATEVSPTAGRKIHDTPVSKLVLTDRFFAAAWDRHHKHRGSESTKSVRRTLLSRDVDWEAFERRHVSYCAYWDRKGWNFCPVTLIEWLDNGMPPPPPEAALQESPPSRSTKLLEQWARE